MPTKTYVRKEGPDPDLYSDPTKGSPSFAAGALAALPERTWRLRAVSDDLYVDIDGDALTQQESDDLDQAWTDWVPADPPNTSPLRILPLLDGQEGQDFRTVNYKSGLLTRLHMNITDMTQGEVREVRYFTDEAMEVLALVVATALRMRTPRSPTRTIPTSSLCRKARFAGATSSTTWRCPSSA